MKKLFCILYDTVKQYRSRYCAAIIVSIIYSVVTVIYTALLQNFIDTVLVNRDFTQIVPIVLLFIGTAIITVISTVVRNVLIESINQNILYEKRKLFLDRLFGAKYQSIRQWNAGEMLDRYHKVSVYAEISDEFINEFIVELFSFLFITCYIFYLNPILAGIVFVGTIATSASQYFISKKTKRYATTKVSLEQSIAKKSNEYFDCFAWIKNLGIADYAISNIEVSLKGLKQEKVKYTLSASVIDQISYLVFEALKIAIYVYSGLQVLSGEITPGGFVAFYSYIGWLDYSFGKLWRMVINLSDYSASVDLVTEITELPKESSTADCVCNQAKELAVTGLSFQYKNGTENFFSLHDVSMVFSVGYPTVIFGRSGCGKSTLLNMIAGFIKQDDGSITLDSKCIDALSPEQRGAFIGYVPQDISVFSGTLKENLSLNRTYTDDELWQAVYIADLDAFVMSLPEKLDTTIGRKDIILSVGQRQRLAIAQAVLRNRPILILDEPTANLDAASRANVIERLEAWGQDKILIYVMHYLENSARKYRMYDLEALS